MIGLTPAEGKQVLTAVQRHFTRERQRNIAAAADDVRSVPSGN
jgi:hypothetical protein